jgi:tetratricopeptide (TPR) repeat protein
MMTRKKLQGLLAASLYEDLSPAEQRELQAGIKEDPDLADDSRKFQALVARISEEESSWQGDLLPALQEQITQAKPARRGLWRMPLVGASAFCVLLVVLGLSVFRSPSEAPKHANPLDAVMAQALEGMETDYLGALEDLEEALRANPGNARAGDVQLLIADLEFRHGQRYGQAYAAYLLAREKYPEAWRNDAQNTARLNLLDEAREQQYASLYALDAARLRDGDTAFGALETVVARYPGTLAATEAVGEMCSMLTQTEAEQDQIQILETAKARCTEAAAIAQINLALGDRYWQDQHDADKARAAYSEVAQEGPSMLAQVAENALSTLP